MPATGSCSDFASAPSASGLNCPSIVEVGELRSTGDNFRFRRAVVGVQHPRRAGEPRHAHDVTLRPFPVVDVDHLADATHEGDILLFPFRFSKDFHAVGQVLRDLRLRHLAGV